MWDLIVSVPDHCLSFYFVGDPLGLQIQNVFIQPRQSVIVSGLTW